MTQNEHHLGGAAHPLSRWTQEERDAIATMMRDGLSATQIGDEFGVSRRTIIGLAYRDKQLKQIGFAGSRGRTGRRGPQKPRKPAALSKSANNLTWRMQQKPKLRVVKPEPAPAIDRAVFGAPHVAGIRLADFNSHRCKWCINDPEQGANEHLFCGETTNDGRPYCAYHATLAYRPVGRVDERGTDRQAA